MRGAGGDIGSDDLGVSSLVAYETLSLDGEFGAMERPGSVPRLDLTNSETDDTIREQFHSQAQWGAREVKILKKHVPLSHRWTA